MKKFDTDLAWGNYAARLPFWDREFFPRVFPDFVRREIRDEDGDDQRDGIDCLVHLAPAASGQPRIVRVDLKSRRDWYLDVLLEAWSVWHLGKPGWAIKPLRADFIAYANVVTGTGYLFPTIPLQEAFRRNEAAWREKYARLHSHTRESGGYLLAPNDGYFTANVAVEIDDLKQALGEVLVTRFTSIPELEKNHVCKAWARFGGSNGLAKCACSIHDQNWNWTP